MLLLVGVAGGPACRIAALVLAESLVGGVSREHLEEVVKVLGINLSYLSLRMSLC